MEQNVNNHDYVDLGLPSGTLWATCNVGAYNPYEYGKYFACGETEGYYDDEYHDFSWKNYKYSNNDGSEFTKYNTSDEYGIVDNKLELELEDDAAHANMGGDWKMPTSAQIEELFKETNHVWVSDYNGTGFAGRVFTSKTNGNSMFIPASGCRFEASVIFQGFSASLRSSSLSTDYPSGGVNGHFYSDGFDVFPSYRDNGYCVRGVLTPAQ